MIGATEQPTEKPKRGQKPYDSGKRRKRILLAAV